MDNVGNIALTHAAMMARATDVTANNIANANTDGYKTARLAFEKMVADTGSADEMSSMSYSIDKGTWLDLASGPLTSTGNRFDMAIQGEGHFAFQRPDGSIAYGRGGSLTPNAAGELSTADGSRLLDIGGAPIQIQPDLGDISVAADGTLSAGGDIIGQVGVFNEPGIGTWKRLDGAMVVPREGAPAMTPVLDPQIRQGFTESSNVSPVLEMTRMIEQQRAFERAISLADSANELRGQTIRRLGSGS